VRLRILVRAQSRRGFTLDTAIEGFIRNPATCSRIVDERQTAHAGRRAERDRVDDARSYCG
jgi:hypothetical protein